MRKSSGIALWGVPLLSRKLREQPKTQVLKSEPGAPAVSLYFNFTWRGANLDAWGQRKFRNSTQATRPQLSVPYNATLVNAINIANGALRCP